MLLLLPDDNKASVEENSFPRPSPGQTSNQPLRWKEENRQDVEDASHLSLVPHDGSVQVNDDDKKADVICTMNWATHAHRRRREDRVISPWIFLASTGGVFKYLNFLSKPPVSCLLH